MEQKAQTRRGVRTDPDIVQAIRDLRPGWNAAQIKRQLDDEEKFRGRVPELRTVQAIVKRYTPRDTSGDWSVLTADAEEARWVLPVLGWWLQVTEGRLNRFTKRQGAWVAKLAAMSGGRLAPTPVLIFADDLIREEDDPEHTYLADIEVKLAFLAWASWDVGRARTLTENHDRTRSSLSSQPWRSAREAITPIIEQVVQTDRRKERRTDGA